MNVLIKGMNMPRSCWECDLHCFRDNGFHDKETIKWGSTTIIPEDFRCGGNNEWHETNEFDFLNERHPDCPLVEVPTPHGRLIDADKFLEWLQEFYPNSVAIMSGVKNAKTIIEAEE